jgi:hypothetical protein
VPVTRRTQMPWARCVLKRQVQLAVRGVGFVVVRFVEPQHVWDLGIGAIWHERISMALAMGARAIAPPIAAAANPGAM